MTLQQLRDFVAVVTHGGYRSAARALDVAQAGLTKSIAKLELEHGVALLDRQGKGVTLTADGVAFLRHAHAVILEADRAQAWLRAASKDGRSGAATVTLGVSIEPSLQLVPAVLNDFRRAMPDVALRLTQGVATALLAGVRESRLELAVTRLPPDFEDRDLTVRPLFESESVVAARPDHPLVVAGRPVDGAALSTWEWVVIGDPSQPAERDASILELFDAHGHPRPRVAAVTDSLFEVVAMLASADLLARLPAAALAHPLVAGRLKAVPLDGPASPRYTIAIVHKASRTLSPAARTLAAMLGSMVRSQASAGRDR
jgi:LysR family transcriptional regulator of abg operon